MKILVFSDSHRSLVGMYRAIETHRPDQVIHLGDLQRDAEEVSLAYPQLPICMVPGNCDGWTTEAPKKQITLAGTQVLLSHGHLWYVKQSYDAALADARVSGADILLFGHTHRSVCQQMEDGLWMLNPGPSRTSYGLILLERDHIQCSICPQP